MPHGIESRKRVLGAIEVFNDGTGTRWLGSYGFRRLSSDGRKIATGVIGEFKRTQHGPWTLLAAVLEVLKMNRSDAWRDDKPRGRLL